MRETTAPNLPSRRNDRAVGAFAVKWRETTAPNLPNRQNDRVVGAFAVKCAKRPHQTCRTGEATASFGAFDHERANEGLPYGYHSVTPRVGKLEGVCVRAK